MTALPVVGAVTGERQAFEKWYLRDHFNLNTSAASLAWSAWQEAFASGVNATLMSALHDIEMETRDGGQWTAAEINEVARHAIKVAGEHGAVSKVDAEALVRNLLWDDHPECCGNPVVGAEYGGQQEQVCCGCPEPALLNDAQIVATLRAKFPALEQGTPS